MDQLVELSERAGAGDNYMIAGWHQWADAGAISSGLPRYLIGHTGAKKIGQIKSDGFYLFQVPGTHHFLRPAIKLDAGYRKEMESRQNEFYLAGDDSRGLVIFLGEEPHLNVERYADAFLDAVEELNVRRVAAVGGVYGPMPYDKEREISCVYSLRWMKDELDRYAVRLSNYEGGSTIGTYLVDRAESRGIEFLDFYAFVPAYDFSEVSADVQGLRIENDFKAWFDLTRRINHMFDLGLDLTDLENLGKQVVESMEAQIDGLDREAPELNVWQHIRESTRGFRERPFMPLGDVWERELGHLFDDPED